MKTKYYKQILLGVLCLSPLLEVMAQEDEKCGTTKIMEAMYKAHPEMRQEAIEYEKALQEQIRENKNSRAVDTLIYYIPVVFHVIHINGSENISDAQILDEMKNLNLNFRNLNPYFNTVVPGFDSIAGDARIQFRLATIDPNGNCTNGIDRIYSHLSSNADDNAKLNPWPRGKYLNIWTIKNFSAAVGAGVLAYAIFPSSNPYQASSDGVIVKANVIGSIGTAGTQYSTTLTHEIGHSLNLSHPWGNTNNPEVACGDDGVDDTPITKGRQSKCSLSELYTPICTINPIVNPYTFSKVTPISGITDTTATPFKKDLGATFGQFKAVGVSANSSDSLRFSFKNWSLGGAIINNDTTFDSLKGNINIAKYYEVTIKPNIRYSGKLTGITFNFQRSATGVRSYAVRSSVDGFTNNLSASSTDTMLKIKIGQQFFSRYDTTASINGSKIDLSGAGYTNFTTPITFRFYGWNAEDAAGAFSIDNVLFIGSVGAIENVQNYMDYSWCTPGQVMFTIGQKDRMRAALQNTLGQRNKLWIGSNLIATGTNGNAQVCAPHPDFYANRYSICAGGSSTITFTRNISNGAPTGNPVWYFPGGTPSTSTATNPVISYNNPGTYDVKLVATNSAGSDSVVKIGFIQVSGSTGDVYGTYKETFENANNFWSWQVNNLDGNAPKTWSYSTGTGYNSNRSVNMLAYDNYLGDVDELISPSYNLSNVSNVTLSFRCAAASAATTSGTMNDILNVYSSNTCGQSWQLRTSLTKLSLINNGYHVEYYVPSSSSDWALQTISIPSGIATSNVRFKFEYVSGSMSNNIYIDDINVDGLVGINENALGTYNVSIYPNPASQNSTINYYLNQKSTVKITLLDVLGKVVFEANNNAQAEGTHSLIISKQELNLNNGIYFVKFTVDNNSTITKKLIITE